MSREVRRVPLDFDWPLDKTWDGYLRPGHLDAEPCADCNGRGWSKAWRALHDIWYGNSPFIPEQNGSTPFAWDHPAVLAFAQRNVAHSPEYYGSSPSAFRREAERLAVLFNGSWSHHLSAVDVAALIEKSRLRDFTHAWSRDDGWTPKDPPVVPTPEQVNEWSLGGLAHDSSNAWHVIEARLERDGLGSLCPTCKGSGEQSDRPLGHLVSRRAMENDAWERTDPPVGEGWQLWQTVGEGSPITPVLPTSDALTEHLATVGTSWAGPMRRSAAEALVRAGCTIGSFVAIDGQFLDSTEDADLIEVSS